MKKSLIVCGALALALSPLALAGQTTDDERMIRQVVEDYFAAITDYDAAALERAFHPDAVISSYLPSGRMYRSPFSQWGRFIERERPADADRYQNRIVSVDIAGTAAVAKTDLVWPTVHYVDYLSLLKIDGTWKIVNKIWFQEPPRDDRPEDEAPHGEG